MTEGRRFSGSISLGWSFWRGGPLSQTTSELAWIDVIFLQLFSHELVMSLCVGVTWTSDVLTHPKADATLLRATGAADPYIKAENDVKGRRVGFFFLSALDKKSQKKGIIDNPAFDAEVACIEEAVTDCVHTLEVSDSSRIWLVSESRFMITLHVSWTTPEDEKVWKNGSSNKKLVQW